MTRARLFGWLTLIALVVLVVASPVAAKKKSAPAPPPAPPSLFDEALTDGGGLWEFRANGETLAAAIADETNAVRVAHWLFQGRAVRAEYAEGGVRAAFGAADADGAWHWYRREGERFVPVTIKPYANDPLIDAIKAQTGRLLARRVAAGDRLQKSDAAPAFPLPAESAESSLRISIAHNVPSPDTPPLSPGAAPPDYSDPAVRDAVLAGETARRAQLQPIRLPRMVVRDFETVVHRNHDLAVDRDAFGDSPPVRASLDLTMTAYRVFVPRTVSTDEGDERRRLHLCARVVIESYVDDGFCFDEALEPGKPIVHSQSAQDAAGRDWGAWFIEVYLE